MQDALQAASGRRVEVEQAEAEGVATPELTPRDPAHPHALRRNLFVHSRIRSPDDPSPVPSSAQEEMRVLPTAQCEALAEPCVLEEACMNENVARVREVHRREIVEFKWPEVVQPLRRRLRRC